MPFRFEHVKNFLGKPIMDSYGKSLGRVVGFTVNAKNEVETFDVETGDGEYRKLKGDRVKIRNGKLVYIYGWRVEANILERVYSVSLARLKALDTLYKNGEITGEAYEKLKAMYNSAIEELESKKVSFIESLKRRVETLEGRIKDLEYVLAVLKLQYILGEILPDTFNEARSSIEKGISYYRSEKEDIEKFICIAEKGFTPIVESGVRSEVELSEKPGFKLEEATSTKPLEKPIEPLVVRVEE
ncbi:MAG: CdvA-like protein [Nitrososphaerota archaeon]|nr:CdvA-like protein [Candidatus Bathyarchaeota archaeon]MDW8061650.1 CdvA-like protein [Nitrososphaerota archaeon]